MMRHIASHRISQVSGPGCENSFNMERNPLTHLLRARDRQDRPEFGALCRASLLTIDGYLDATRYTPVEIADAIMKRPASPRRGRPLAIQVRLNGLIAMQSRRRWP
jgi:hypothetical protein